MALIQLANIRAAQNMYSQRVDFLRTEVSRIVHYGEQLGEAYQTETMGALNEIENELDGIDECLELLRKMIRIYYGS